MPVNNQFQELFPKTSVISFHKSTSSKFLPAVSQHKIIKLELIPFN